MNTLPASQVPQVIIRPATVEDAQAINAIYNHYVVSSTATWQTEEETLEARQKALAECSFRNIVTVVEVAGEVLGWASLRPYKLRSGYRFTAEESVYLRHDAQGRGLGTLLLRHIFRQAVQAGYQTVIAGVSADQVPSLGLHRKLGFTQVGHLHAVGVKFDQQLDSIILQLLPQDLARFA